MFSGWPTTTFSLSFLLPCLRTTAVLLLSDSLKRVQITVYYSEQTPSLRQQHAPTPKGDGEKDQLGLTWFDLVGWCFGASFLPNEDERMRLFGKPPACPTRGLFTRRTAERTNTYEVQTSSVHFYVYCTRQKILSRYLTYHENLTSGNAPPGSIKKLSCRKRKFLCRTYSSPLRPIVRYGFPNAWVLFLVSGSTDYLWLVTHIRSIGPLCVIYPRMKRQLRHWSGIHLRPHGTVCQ